MKKLIFIIVAIIALLASWYAIYSDFRDRQAEYIELMKNNDYFDGTTVDMLWHFKNENCCSEEFLKLYDQKIKPLPGERF